MPSAGAVGLILGAYLPDDGPWVADAVRILRTAGLRDVLTTPVGVRRAAADIPAGVIVVVDPGRCVAPWLLPSAVADVIGAVSATGGDGARTGGPAAAAATITGPVTDTLKQVDAAGVVHTTADRDLHRTLLTPCAVPVGAVLSAAAEIDEADLSIEALLRAASTAAEGAGVVCVPSPEL